MRAASIAWTFIPVRASAYAMSAETVWVPVLMYRTIHGRSASCLVLYRSFFRTHEKAPAQLARARRGRYLYSRVQDTGGFRFTDDGGHTFNTPPTVRTTGSTPPVRRFGVSTDTTPPDW